MNVIEFREEIMAQIKDYLPSSFADIDITPFDKTAINGNIKYGITVRIGKISPTIYLDQIAEGYDFICPAAFGQVAELIQKYSEIPAIDVDHFSDFAEVSKNIYLKLCNGSNADRFDRDGIVYRKVMDLLIYVVEGIEIGNGWGTVTIKENMLDMWGITKDELFNIAGENSREMTDVKDMVEVIHEKAPFMYIPTDGPKMIVVNYKKQLNGGAAAILFPEVRESVSRILGTNDMAIIPCSVNETIFIVNPHEAYLCNQMIGEVNVSEVAPDDVLSDHLYYSYDGGLSMHEYSSEEVA